MLLNKGRILCELIFTDKYFKKYKSKTLKSINFNSTLSFQTDAVYSPRAYFYRVFILKTIITLL